MSPYTPTDTELDAGEAVLPLKGRAAALHPVRQTVQTLMEYLSGIASNAADIVTAAYPGSPALGIASTRYNIHFLISRY